MFPVPEPKPKNELYPPLSVLSPAVAPTKVLFVASVLADPVILPINTF